MSWHDYDSVAMVFVKGSNSLSIMHRCLPAHQSDGIQSGSLRHTRSRDCQASVQDVDGNNDQLIQLGNGHGGYTATTHRSESGSRIVVLKPTHHHRNVLQFSAQRGMSFISISMVTDITVCYPVFSFLFFVLLVDMTRSAILINNDTMGKRRCVGKDSVRRHRAQGSGKEDRLLLWNLRQRNRTTITEQEKRKSGVWKP
jgi:hypothetical protein